MLVCACTPSTTWQSSLSCDAPIVWLTCIMRRPHAQLMSVQPINKEEFSTIFGPAAMHAVGHVAANLSFAAVAISLTHTVKTLEPAFNVALSRIFLGTNTPLPVVTTLIPIMVSRYLLPMVTSLNPILVSRCSLPVVTTLIPIMVSAYRLPSARLAS